MKLDMRKFKRFDLKIPAEVRAASPGAGVLELVTKNVSAGGAFFDTGPSLSKGLHVFVELLLSRRRGPRKEARVKVEGDVLRSGPEGMAIRFREGYSIA